MGCKTCGGGKRFSKDIPILDINGKQIAENYTKYKGRSKQKPYSRVRSVQPTSTQKNIYLNLTKIEFSGQRINVLNYDKNQKCIYIVGWMEGCGACNYMKRLINKIVTPEMLSKLTVYILDKSITDPEGFVFTGNPTILFVDKGKLVFQVGGIFNQIDTKIRSYMSS
jgi:hypothetical protein